MLETRHNLIVKVQRPVGGWPYKLFEPNRFEKIVVPAFAAFHARRNIRTFACKRAVGAREVASRKVSEEVGQVEKHALFKCLFGHMIFEPEDLG
jgi:hypothetical protein